MKRSLTLFLQAVVVLIGIGTLVLMLWFPHIEGRNANATFSQIYFNDPFLAYAYIASIAFFAALYQAFILLTYIGKNKVFSHGAVKALRAIKYCAITLTVFILGAIAYFSIFQRGTEDIAGGVSMGLVMIFIAVVTGTAAAVFQRTLQNAIDIQSENDLAV